MIDKNCIKIFLLFSLIFFNSYSTCFIHNCGNSLLKELKDFQHYIENNKALKDNTISRKLKRSNSILHSNGAELFEILYNILNSKKHDQSNLNKNIYQIFKNKSYKIKEDPSFLEHYISIDILFIYAMIEVIVTLILAFVIVPLVVIMRNKVKKILRKSIGEKNLDDENLLEFYNNLDHEEICSICLDRVINGNINENYIGHLNCGHNYHRNCIMEWIERTKDTCPFCRKTIDNIEYVEISKLTKKSEHNCKIIM